MKNTDILASFSTDESPTSQITAKAKVCGSLTAV